MAGRPTAHKAELHTTHTADLPATTRRAVRGLLDAVFAGELTDDDWEHALGGLHVLAWEGAALVGHAAVVQRRLLHGGRALRTGYVEAVAVRADRRRRGHGGALMRIVERIVRAAYELGALGAAHDALAFYASLGWRRWEGPLRALTPAGVAATPDERGGVHVLPVSAPLDLAGELTCDWRDGDVW